MKQKSATAAAQNMMRYAALIESSQFDWSEAKLSRNGRNSGASVPFTA
jgi:hypothetical protein